MTENKGLEPKAELLGSNYTPEEVNEYIRNNCHPGGNTQAFEFLFPVAKGVNPKILGTYQTAMWKNNEGGPVLCTYFIDTDGKVTNFEDPLEPGCKFSVPSGTVTYAMEAGPGSDYYNHLVPIEVKGGNGEVTRLYVIESNLGNPNIVTKIE